MNKALDKYLEAAELYIEGCNTLDADIILEGVIVYGEGTSFLDLAADEIINIKKD